MNDIAALFEKNKSTISRHINNIYDKNELLRISTVAKNATVQLEGELSRMTSCAKYAHELNGRTLFGGLSWSHYFLMIIL